MLILLGSVCANKMIRLLTIDEIPKAAELGPLFYKEGNLPGSFIPETFIKNWENIFNNNIGFIIGMFDSKSKIIGLLGGIMSADFNDCTLYASEMFWFVKKENRGRSISLLDAYEKEAINRGAKRCSMGLLVGLHPDGLGRIYERRGYSPVEKTYFKTL